jgi:signal transduction histidine kinase
MRKVFFLLYILFLLVATVFADTVKDPKDQAAVIDSLENELHNSLSNNLTEHDKISICNQLSSLYEGSSFEKQIEYSARSLMMADDIKEPTLSLIPLKVLGSANLSLYKFKEAEKWFLRLRETAHEFKQKEMEALALESLGTVYIYSNEYEKAKENIDASYIMYLDLQDYKGIGKALGRIAFIFGHWGEYEDALTKYQEALNYYKEIDDKDGIAGLHNNMGMLYEDMGKLDDAYDYYMLSLDYFSRNGSRKDVVNLKLHIGDIYLKKGNINKALDYFFEADSIVQLVNDIRLESICLSNIGEAYNQKGDFKKALDYQLKALKLKEEVGDKKRLTITFTEMGKIYFNVKDYEKALENLHKGLKMASEIRFSSQISKCHKILAEVYREMGDHKSSLDYLTLYMEGIEIVHSEQNRKMLAELKAKYDLEQQNKDYEALVQSEQLSKARIRNQWMLIGFVLMILVGTLIFSSVILSRSQQNQKLNVKLSIQNKEIEKQQEKLKELNTSLKKANSSKDKFFSIVAHDLKNPFNSLILLTSLLIDEYDSFTEDEKKKYLQQINESSRNTFSLLQNLLEWARSQIGGSHIVKEKVNLGELSESVIALLQPTANNKNISVATDISNSVIAYADKNMVSTILLNLVSNAIKFTSNSGKVSISSFVENNHIEVIVSDNGMGMSKENLSRLFRLEEKFQTRGTAKEAGTGLGLILCKEFIEKNDGKIWVESEENVGSQFHFTLPVS